MCPSYLLFPLFVFSCYRPHRALHSFPTRRSSDLSACLLTRPDPGTTIARRTFDATLRPRATVAAERRSSIREFRSEEHTSELQSHSDLVCRLLLEKKKQKH